MIKFEKTTENDLQISIVFEKHVDVEKLGNYKNALLNAIKCISSCSDGVTWNDVYYELADLLQQMSYNYDQAKEIELFAKMNQERVKVLKEIPWKREFEKNGMTKDQQELQKILFD